MTHVLTAALRAVISRTSFFAIFVALSAVAASNAQTPPEGFTTKYESSSTKHNQFKFDSATTNIGASAVEINARENQAPTAGEIDPTFNPTLDFYPGNARRIVFQPDGKILIGGYFKSINGVPAFDLLRANADGSPDSSFAASVNNIVHAIVPLPDGKILIGGGFTLVNGAVRNRVARLNADGSLDATFNPGLGANNVIYDLLVQQTGKIVVAGFFSAFNGVARNNIARLNQDGSPDNSFVSPIEQPGAVYTLAAESNGKILIGGFLTIANNFGYFARLTIDGAAETLVSQSALGGTVYKIVLQPDGRILLGGAFSSFNGVLRNRLVRLNPNLTLDATFDPGAGANNNVWSIESLPTGKILIGGFFTVFNNVSRGGVALLNNNGTLDTAFNNNNQVTGGFYSARSLPSGSILAAGSFTAINGVQQNALALFNPDGTLDTTITVSSLARADLRVAVPQTDGKIIVGGSFNLINGAARNRIARLNADGSVDSTFNVGSGVNAQVYAVVLQPDGKILIGGSFTTYNGVGRGRIARLNQDGSLDATFNPVSGADGFVAGIALQADGKILIVGDFLAYNGANRSGVARLNADGSLDSTFVPGVGNPLNNDDPFVEGVAVQPDGKIIVGGIFNTVNGIVRPSLARLNANGSLDTSFIPATTNNPVTEIYALALQPDGKILLGGLFTFVGGAARNNVARLNADGSLDVGFNNGVGANNAIEDILVAPNGKILLAGTFTSVNNVNRRGVARLNSDGTVDPAFAADADDAVWDISLQADGKVLMSGDFLNVNNQPRTGVARLLSEPLVSSRAPFDFDGDGRTDYAVFRSSNSTWYVQRSASGFLGFQFGISNDKNVAADYDGDGRTDTAVFRDGTWYLQRSASGFAAVRWGQTGDSPVPGDYDADGRTDTAVFRGGVWYILLSSTNQTRTVQFGVSTDKPVPADFDGDGSTDIAVFRDGVWYWLNSSDNNFRVFKFGTSGDVPVPADFDGDAKADFAVYRGGTWYIQRSQSGFAAVQFGTASDVPTIGDYDGDGKSDIAVWRPADGTFYLLRSGANNQFTAFQWGANGDIPVAAANIP